MSATRRPIPLATKLAVLAYWTDPGQKTVYCNYCMEEARLEWNYRGPILRDGFQWDHVIPVFHGGGDGPDNIVIACGPCNRKKGARLDFIGDLEQWHIDHPPATVR